MRRESGIGRDVGMSKAGKCQDNSEFSGVTKWIQIASERQEASFQTKRTRLLSWKTHRLLPKMHSKNGLKLALYRFFFMRQRPKRRAFAIPSRCHRYPIALRLDSDGNTNFCQESTSLCLQALCQIIIFLPIFPPPSLVF